MITYVQIFGGLHPRNLGGPKIKNLTRFRKTLDFDHEYLRNLSRYQKSGNKLDRHIPAGFSKRNLVNFGPQTKKVTSVDVDPPEFRIWRHWATSNFYHKYLWSGLIYRK